MMQKKKPDKIFTPLPPKIVKARQKCYRFSAQKFCAIEPFPPKARNSRIVNGEILTKCNSGRFTNINFVSIYVPVLDDYAFYNRRTLRIVHLATVRSIGNYAFGNCFNLIILRLSSSVQKLGSNIFNNCNKIKIHYSGTMEQWDKIQKHPLWSQNCKLITVHCLDGNFEIKLN